LNASKTTWNRSSEQATRTETNLAALAQAVNTIATAHSGQIDKLLKIAEIQLQRWEQLQREWQTYLTTIHPKQ